MKGGVLYGIMNMHTENKPRNLCIIVILTTLLRCDSPSEYSYINLYYFQKVIIKNYLVCDSRFISYCLQHIQDTGSLLAIYIRRVEQSMPIQIFAYLYLHMKI